MIDYALKLDEYVLYFSNKEIEAESGKTQIIDTENGGRFFCKGIFVCEENSIFSYNFKNAELNYDRNAFKQEPLFIYHIAKMSNYDIYKKVIEYTVNYYKTPDKKSEVPKECSNQMAKELKETCTKNSCGNIGKYRAYLIKRAFEEIFQEEIKSKGLKGVALKTEYKVPDGVQEALNEYLIIDYLPKEWIETLAFAGVNQDKDIVPEYMEENVSTSLTLKYAATWGEKRIMLDSCQNHLPSDSGGENIYLQFQTDDGEWHEYTEFEKYKNSQIKKIKISDDGIGYDYKSLGLLSSIKNHDDSTGKWGEGIKMISAAALNKGIKVELHSRNWTATPYTTKEVVNEGMENEETVDRLNFSIKIDTKAETQEPKEESSDSKKESSYTTFIDPTPELIQEFRNIKENVLNFSDKHPQYSVDGIDVLDTVGGKVYVKNVLIPGVNKTKYTYHFKNFEIENRDRNAISDVGLTSQIYRVLSNTNDESFIRTFLMDAANHVRKKEEFNFAEFNTKFNIPTRTENADMWINVFQDFFGENSCIQKLTEQDGHDAAMSEHLGLNVVVLPDKVADGLLKIETRDGKKIPSYEDKRREAIENAIPVDESELNPEQKAIIEQLYKMNDVIKLNPDTIHNIEEIKIYRYADDYPGTRASGFAHFGNLMNINIETLNRGLGYSLDVFFHENGHNQTGGDDASKEFRDYQTKLLAEMAKNMLPMEKSIIDNGLIGKTRLTKFKNTIKKFFWKMVSKDYEKNNGTEEEEVQI